VQDEELSMTPYKKTGLSFLGPVSAKAAESVYASPMQSQSVLDKSLEGSGKNPANDPGKTIKEPGPPVKSRRGASARVVQNDRDDNGQKAEEEIQEEERDIMEEALALLDASQEAWEKGDLETSQSLLDEAYALIIETDGDTDISRQKDDLRLLIARRILTVYSSRQTVTSGKRSEIPLRINADVEKEIRLFQSVERDFFISSYERAFKYRPIILRELKLAGLPEELSWLPLVESGFKVSALSRARALGLWQFIPSTGYKYELNRDEWIDERMDVEKSTRAAISYLKELHDMFGDWLTVLAAYNCGEGRVLKVISRQHINYFDRFWDLYHQLPYETARYVPRFLATLAIIKDPQKYGMDLKTAPHDGSCPYEIVKTQRQMRLGDIATRIEVPEETLVFLNSELRHKATPPREYALKLPLEKAETFVALEGEIPSWEPELKPATVKKSLTIRHRVQRGETVVTLARKYRTSVKAILSYNHLSSRTKLKAGRIVAIPIPSYRTGVVASNDKETERPDRGTPIRYTVKRGDTLLSVASRYGVSIAQIKKVNGLRGNTVKAGQVLSISSELAEQSSLDPARTQKARSTAGSKKKAKRTYTVKKGDTLNRIAAKNNLSLSALKDLNRIRDLNHIQPGQTIVVE
jgi:membrane-bound lytic murein transglycosylase D